MNEPLETLLEELLLEMEARARGFAASWPGPEINAAREHAEDLCRRIRFALGKNGAA